MRGTRGSSRRYATPLSYLPEKQSSRKYFFIFFYPTRLIISGIVSLSRGADSVPIDEFHFYTPWSWMNHTRVF